MRVALFFNALAGTSDWLRICMFIDEAEIYVRAGDGGATVSS